LSSTTLERNVDALTSAYKQQDPESKLEVGTWLAHFGDATIVDGVLSYREIEDTISDLSDECKLSPLIIKMNDRGMHVAVSLRFTYKYGEFSFWDRMDKEHWVVAGEDTVEYTIPAHASEGDYFVVGVYDSCKISKVELLTDGDVDLNISLLGLASTNTKMLSMFTFEEQRKLIEQVFLQRFVSYLPSWENTDEQYPRGRLPLGEYVAKRKAEELKLLKRGTNESLEKYIQRIQGKRYWVIPRNFREIESNIHYLMARYLDLDEDDIIIYEKAANVIAENPDESDRDKMWAITEIAGWEDDQGIIQSSTTSFIYDERIKNKDFSTRLYVSSISGIDTYWYNAFDNDGQFNNTEELISGEGYCFTISNRGAPDDDRGFTATNQKVDFDQVRQVDLYYRVETHPPNVFDSPGSISARAYIVVSDQQLSGYTTKISDLLTTGTILQEHVVYFNDYPTPTVSHINLDVSGITGERYLYFIIKSDIQFASMSIDKITFDYGTATSISPLLDVRRNQNMKNILSIYTLNDPAAIIQWRYRAGNNSGDVYASPWSTWRNITNRSINTNARYFQTELRFSSVALMEETPVELQGMFIRSGYDPKHYILLDPTYVVSLPAQRRGDNYMWSYASGDRTAFKEIVDSTCPAGVTARTEFYLEDVEDEI